MNWFKRLFKVRPNEVAMVWGVSLLFFLIQYSLMFGLRTAGSLFNNRAGADKLPYIYIFFGLITVFLTIFYTMGLNRINKGRFFSILLALSAGILIVLHIFIPLEAPAFLPSSLEDVLLIYPVLLVVMKIINILLSTMMWNVAGVVCDTRQAKRLFVIFNSAALLGAVLGNLTIKAVTSSLGVRNLIYIQVVGLTLSLLVMAWIAARFFPQEHIAPERLRKTFEDIRTGFDFVRSSNLLRQVALFSVFMMLMYYMLDMPFKQEVAHRFTENEYASFMGGFGSVIKVVTFLFAILATNWIINDLGVVNAGFILPLAYLAGFGAMYFLPSFESAVIARSLQLIVLGGVANTVNKSLFNVVPVDNRAQVLSFNDLVMEQVGAIAAGILLLFAMNFHLSNLFLGGMFISGLTIVLLWQMRSSYPQALLDAIRKGKASVFDTGVNAFGEIKLDRAVISSIIKELESKNPVARRMTIEILTRMDTGFLARHLRPRLEDEDASVRQAALKALVFFSLTMGETISDDEVLRLLGDESVDVQAVIVSELPRIRQSVSSDIRQKLIALKNSKSGKLKSQIVIAFVKLGEKDLAFELLESLLQEQHLGTITAVLDALYEIGKLEEIDLGHAVKKDILEAFLEHANSSVRFRAYRVYEFMPFNGSGELMIRGLFDSEGVVRGAASQALKAHYLHSESLVLEMLEQEVDKEYKISALEALEPFRDSLKSQLLNLARQEIPRLFHLRELKAGLSADTPATALLEFYVSEENSKSELLLVMLIGLLDDGPEMDVVRDGISSTDPQVRAAAIEALDIMGDIPIVSEIISLLDAPLSVPENVLTEKEALVAFLSDNDNVIQALACKSIGEKGYSELRDELEVLGGSKDAFIVEALKQTLMLLGGSSQFVTERAESIPELEEMILLFETEMFGKLPIKLLYKLSEATHEKRFGIGDTLVKQGSIGDSLMVIYRGKVGVFIEEDGQQKQVATFSRGDVFGEMSVLDESPRSATVVAQQNTLAVIIEKEVFIEMILTYHDFALAVLDKLSKRVNELNALVVESGA